MYGQGTNYRIKDRKSFNYFEDLQISHEERIKTAKIHSFLEFVTFSMPSYIYVKQRLDIFNFLMYKNRRVRTLCLFHVSLF